jgi:predicted transcriptional regulator
MEPLTNKEEEVMQIIWDLGPCFVREVLEKVPEPKPHYNTISSLVRSLEEKGYLGHKAYGNTYQYYPLQPKEKYQGKELQKIVKAYFNNSYKSLVSFFAEEDKITEEELKEIMKEIRKGRKKNKN